MKHPLLLFTALYCMALFSRAQVTLFNDIDLQTGKTPHHFLQSLPTLVKWVDDDRILLSHKPHPDSSALTYILNIANGKRVVQTNLLLATKTDRLVLRGGDLFYRNKGAERKLTNDAAEEQNATFSPDSTCIAYTKNNNLYCYRLDNNTETALTTDGSNTILNGFASWVYYEEIFGRATKYRAFWWSPNSKTISFMRFDESKVPTFPLFNNEGQHGQLELTRYPKAGDTNPSVKIGFVSATGGSITWANFSEQDDQYFGWPIWHPSSNSLWVLWMNRQQNTLKIYDVNSQTGNKQEIYSETQKTWIDLEDRVGGRIHFLDNRKGFLLQSDKTGWNHIYWYNADGSLKNAVTTGLFTVQGIEWVDEKNGWVYYKARGKESTARTDLYGTSLDGKTTKRLSFGDFHHTNISHSPSGKYFITTYSNVSTPPQLAVIDRKGKLIRVLGSTRGSQFDKYTTAQTELVRIKSEDGKYLLPAVVTWPAGFDPDKKYPLLISIYGGPNAGTVWDAWNWTPLRQWYAQEGVIQVAFDHRGSGHFGKEGMNYLHRNLGYWEMTDYTTMAQWFINKGYANPSKIAITGFSYGGYISCYAITYGADVFTHAMAGGSVVDWRLYDSHYTERFMSTPADNPLGYKNSSVLTFADNYKGRLLLVHGTADDNVHMQNSLQLVSALQDKGKQFDLMLYPGGKHGWRNLPAKNRHFEQLKHQFIYQYLLQKKIPNALTK